jgi:hypothetical protein
MKRLSFALLPCLFYSSLVMALEEQRSNVTQTTWEIYGMVLLVIVVGAVWLLLKSRHDEKKKKRRAQPQG